ncbi:MAG: peptidoglycan DD-metalloendopeptidase family protein [Buchnera aphidicola (Pentalonia nigronervosa)]|jgi:lipoprotein NlpD|uniref:Peptidoglycan DD-metalloendopeptidase family protein n=1 Tax=Buchnera aphidicola (Pentalonia nigronervosa) TaxID=1309793 RepID=A0A7H1AYR9_9GAMM|nr:MAG: peptidoglycan DD-metalloendopeptidase family protein [Buchnera aphidicola (Pentalonia nigronervosa)]
MLMQRKIILLKTFFLFCVFFIHSDFALGGIISKKCKYELISNRYSPKFNTNNISKNNITPDRHECFSIFKIRNNLFPKQIKVIIRNENFIGLLKNKMFKIFYIVKRGDTLYSIGKNLGYDYRELSKINFIKKPNHIFIGQKIWIKDIFFNTAANTCFFLNKNKNNKKKYYFCNFLSTSSSMLNFLIQHANLFDICFTCKNQLNKKNTILKNNQFLSFFGNWTWPIQGKNIKYFYDSKSYDQKIEILGYRGQPIFSVESGKVMYISDELKKYGKLIIIKHNNNYLSVYGFNDTILVHQEDKVYKKQQIATMGFSEENVARLYFEIRYKGCTINPLHIFPKN